MLRSSSYGTFARGYPHSRSYTDELNKGDQVASCGHKAERMIEDSSANENEEVCSNGRISAVPTVVLLSEISDLPSPPAIPLGYQNVCTTHRCDKGSTLDASERYLITQGIKVEKEASEGTSYITLSRQIPNLLSINNDINGKQVNSDRELSAASEKLQMNGMFWSHLGRQQESDGLLQLDETSAKIAVVDSIFSNSATDLSSGIRTLQPPSRESSLCETIREAEDFITANALSRTELANDMRAQGHSETIGEHDETNLHRSQPFNFSYSRRTCPVHGIQGPGISKMSSPPNIQSSVAASQNYRFVRKSTTYSDV